MEAAGRGVSSEVRLVDLLAAYLKASFMYPENNASVRRASNDFIRLVKDVATIDSPVAMEFRGNGVFIDGKPVDDRPLLPWLRECISKANLNGLRFMITLNQETLSMFARCLAESHVPGGDFFTGWPPDQKGLQPMSDTPSLGGSEQRETTFIDDSFGGLSNEPLQSPQSGYAVDDDPPRRRHDDPPQARLPSAYEQPGRGSPYDQPATDDGYDGDQRPDPMPLPLAEGTFDSIFDAPVDDHESEEHHEPTAPDEQPEAETNELAAVVADQLAVRHAVHELIQLVEMQNRGMASLDGDKLIHRIVGLLPVDTNPDPLWAGGACARILRVVCREVEVALALDPHLDSDAVGEKAFQAALRCIQIGTFLTHEPAAPQAERSREEEVQKNLADLTREVTQLPRRHLVLPAHDPKLCAELLGIHLHLLLDDLDWSPRMDNPELTMLIKRKGKEQLRVLDAYLEGEENEQPSPRLLEFLKNCGHHAAAGAPALTPEQVIQTFPTQFLPFIDALQLDNQEHAAKLLTVLRHTSSEAMRQAVQLMVDNNLLNPERAEKLLVLGGTAAADVAYALAASNIHWARDKLVDFLRRQELPPAETTALRIVRDSGSFESEYLTDLCEAIGQVSGSARLHGYTSYLLRQFIRHNADRPESVEYRIFAIRALGHVPNFETIQFLRQISKTGRLLQQSKDARAIRQAASDALKQINAGGPPA